MFTKPWHYLINTFLVVTASNYKKALSLGVDHLAKLVANQSDAFIAAMVATFDPVMQAFMAAQQNLDAALGDYKGETQSVEGLFKLMNDEKLSYWEGQVFYFYPKGSDQATQLLPKGRGPFQTGTYEQRILAIKTFGDKCALITNLVPLSVNVLAFHTQIASARALQQSSGEGQVATLRTLRETARVMLCTEMFSNLGLLMSHYKTNPTQVGNYFDLTLVRSKSKSASDETTISGKVTNAVTGDPVVATLRFMRSSSPDIIEVQTDINGDFEANLGVFTEVTNVTVEVTATGFDPFTNSGPMEPGDDVEVNIQLQPTVVPPTP